MKNLRVRYHVLKTIVNLLGLFEWLAGGYGLLSFYSQDNHGWVWAIILLSISYMTSCELSYYVNRIQIRLEIERSKNE